MISFEKHLIENGWTTTDTGHYSSLGTVQKKYTKDGKEIIIGLSERGKPVTLVYPRPTIIHKGFYENLNDDFMNRILQTIPNERILESLFDPKIKFYL